MVHGDRRKYVTALITLNSESATRWARDNGVAFGSFAELSQRPELKARLQQTINALNAKQPTYSSIRKFAILDHDWSQETGEITPTLKVKRKVVTAKYKEILDGFYDGESYDV